MDIREQAREFLIQRGEDESLEVLLADFADSVFPKTEAISKEDHMEMLQMPEPFYLFMKFGQDENPLHLATCNAERISFSLDRPTDSAQFDESADLNTAVLSVNQEIANSIEFFDEKREKSFKLYAKSKNGLSEIEKELLPWVEE